MSILMTCTGNICRSPFAERLLGLLLQESGAFEVRSAGLRAVVGHPMDSESARQLELHGGDSHNHRALQLTREMVEISDLILTMTKDQRDEVIQRYPVAMNKTFTLPEFSKIFQFLKETRQLSFQDLVSMAARCRSQIHLLPSDDIQDPIGADLGVHTAVASQIALHVERVASNFRRTKDEEH